MEHEEFVTLFKSGKLAVDIDRSKAIRVCQDGYLGRAYMVAQTLYTWVWLLGLLSAPVVGYFYHWWVGLIVFVVATRFPKAIKHTACGGIRNKLMEDSEFYNYARDAEVFKITILPSKENVGMAN